MKHLSSKELPHGLGQADREHLPNAHAEAPALATKIGSVEGENQRSFS
jgi:hypothetical protein